MRVLAGDIGGTNARLRIYNVEANRFESESGEVYASREHDSLAEIVESFMASHGLKVHTACFGVPGPVKDGRAEITNLPWIVESTRLARAAGVARVAVINDLEAQAWGIAALDADDLVTLNRGAPDARGNAALIAAGTGLGQAGLYWDGITHRPFACEGGHATFAPRGAIQFALLEFLTRRFGGHVSWERVVSGPGLVNLHDFLIEYRHADASEEHLNELRKEDPAAITDGAFSGNCALCAETLALFIELYGAEASNLALKIMSMGGVYLGGGISPKIVEELAKGEFMRAFLDKGRMRSVLEAMPVRVILSESTALIGAARYASLFEAP
ncbi:MAG: glucokinase [Gemmatimonadota bacterium]|nr:MAG: glucokinase [Gemmatimonadota bacterium]